VLIEGAGHTRAEIARTAEYEMVTELDDSLRRRSKIAPVVRREQLRTAPDSAKPAASTSATRPTPATPSTTPPPAEAAGRPAHDHTAATPG
jgi:glycerol-3-phosphate dehydrogenase